jgi:hypothetical protein
MKRGFNNKKQYILLPELKKVHEIMWLKSDGFVSGFASYREKRFCKRFIND